MLWWCVVISFVWERVLGYLNGECNVRRSKGGNDGVYGHTLCEVVSVGSSVERGLLFRFVL